MLALSDLDISIGDGIKLLEYNDLQYFVDIYSKKRDYRKLMGKLERINEALLINNAKSSERGVTALAREQKRIESELLKIRTELHGTVFDKLKLKGRSRVLTVFERLKARKN